MGFVYFSEIILSKKIRDFTNLAIAQTRLMAQLVSFVPISVAYDLK
jgi:hypothetical protein